MRSPPSAASASGAKRTLVSLPRLARVSDRLPVAGRFKVGSRLPQYLTKRDVWFRRAVTAGKTVDAHFLQSKEAIAAHAAPAFQHFLRRGQGASAITAPPPPAPVQFGAQGPGCARRTNQRRPVRGVDTPSPESSPWGHVENSCPSASLSPLAMASIPARAQVSQGIDQTTRDRHALGKAGPRPLTRSPVWRACPERPTQSSDRPSSRMSCQPASRSKRPDTASAGGLRRRFPRASCGTASATAAAASTSSSPAPVADCHCPRDGHGHAAELPRPASSRNLGFQP